jgi:hypothetical protein
MSNTICVKHPKYEGRSFPWGLCPACVAVHLTNKFDSEYNRPPGVLANKAIVDNPATLQQAVEQIIHHAQRKKST